MLGRGLAVVPEPIPPGGVEDSSQWNPELLRLDETDPLDRGGSGNKLVDFGEEFDDLVPAPRSVLDSFRIAEGRRRGGVAAAG